MANGDQLADYALAISPTVVVAPVSSATAGQYRFDLDGVQGVACHSVILSNFTGVAVYVKVNLLTSDLSDILLNGDLILPTGSTVDLARTFKTTVKSVSVFILGTVANFNIKGVTVR